MTATEDHTPPHLAAGKPAVATQLILQRRLRLLLPYLPDPCGQLVDFGCGNGAQTLLLAEHCARVTGVDINPDFLAAFDRAIAEANLGERVAGVPLAAGQIPLDDEFADVVTSFTVLEHVPDERLALAEMHRVLKPGGRLIISVPNRWWVFETHGCDLPLLPWNRVPLVSWWPKAWHDRWARARIYRRREIVAMVGAAGFRVDDSFRMTAPMDMIANAALRQMVRATLFPNDRAVFPTQATENFVIATKQKKG